MSRIGSYIEVHPFGTVLTKADPLGMTPRIAGRVHLWAVHDTPLCWMITHPSQSLHASPSYMIPFTEVLRVESLTEEDYNRSEGHSYPRPIES
jgi:hypothetical protein